MITAKYLRSILKYNKRTGEFRWKYRKDKPSRVNTGRVDKIAGSNPRFGHIAISIDCRLYGAHRLAWLYVYGEWPKDEIDHINGNPSDNRLVNLRTANRFQNCWNSRIQSNNTTGYKGVHFYKRRKKWTASIKWKHKVRFLGYFKTPIAAHRAYRSVAEKLQGEFMRAA